MKKLVFIETTCIGTRYGAEAARAFDYEPLFLCRLDEYQADTRKQLLSYAHRNVDTTRLDRVLEALMPERDSIAGIISFHDTELKVAYAAARELGVRGLDPQVVALKNKGEVARLIPEYSPPYAVFPTEAIPFDDLKGLFRFSERLLIKPTEGAGALGAFSIGREDLTGLGARLAAIKLPPIIEDQGHWIAQCFVEGEVISLEGYVVGGKGFLLGYSGRRKVKATESGAAFPIDERIPGPVRVRIADAVKALIRRSGFMNGYFHIEFIFRAMDCSLIDANMGRIGGGAIAEQLALSYGIRPVEVFQHVLEIGLFGRETVNPFRPYFDRRRPTYAILYGLESGGIVDEVLVPPDLPCYHTQVIERGGNVTPMGQDDWSWVGILSGLTPDTMRSIDRVRIRSAGKEFLPYY